MTIKFADREGWTYVTSAFGDGLQLVLDDYRLSFLQVSSQLRTSTMPTKKHARDMVNEVTLQLYTNFTKRNLTHTNEAIEVT